MIDAVLVAVEIAYFRFFEIAYFMKLDAQFEQMRYEQLTNL